ncbi:pilus assembly protein [Ramlibacter pallidus]|uniref:PilY1 beta-propeller domain-containing protein n=1 Tax=Ramlibacter pallidus TaxID=2780087 RepID=A0ABR9S8D5_9BURK|nr:PilC/PilY family type IV pilus protein [Ramlibacter pallidus]MBE7369793.1 hypothetical protein [Ramlibacter pallidus]
MFALPIPPLPARAKRVLQVTLLGSLVAAASLVIGQSSPPLVQLATEPLYMNGAKAKGNLTIALSVEFPTVGATYRAGFDPNTEYVGYFDPNACYKHVPASGGKGAYFDWQKAMPADNDCGGGGFNGNFMNWATSSAIDILRYGLTGGNRVMDEDTGNGVTVVERAWLPDDFYRNGSYFPTKSISKAVAAKMIETSVANQIPAGGNLYIYNCRERVYFSIANDTSGDCASPHGTSADDKKHPYLIGPSNAKYYEVRNMVCDPNTATNRLMTYDPQTKLWRGLCKKYEKGNKSFYKPVGQFQVNSDSLRVSVFGYLNDDQRTRYGGVMRSPMKYLGPNDYDANFNLKAAANPHAEWDPLTGVLKENPQAGHATYGDQGHPRSGAIMYINKFGTLDIKGDYKTYDPVTEMYYEALRYLQGKQPTSKAVSLTGTATQIKRLKENFPVYDTWTDPFDGFQDTTGDAASCLRNSILTIADVFTHSDHEVPGSTRNATDDSARAKAAWPDLDAPYWSKVVGGFEGNLGVAYKDSKGRNQTTSNPNTVINTGGLSGNDAVDFSTLDSQTTGAGTGSYHMAGMAYWANTQTFNITYPKARVQTFAIDVNENSKSTASTTFRRTRQLYLAAKYGGFNDRAAAQTGNPYQPGSNVLWIGADGDAKNYFLASDAQKFLDALAEVFARVVEETGSIAGGAISTTRLTSSESASVYQARFNPVANYWSGRLLKYPISLAADNTIELGSTPTWEAGQILTNRTKVDHGADRNIVIGPPLGRQGVDAAAPFKWANLPTAHQTALNTLDGVVDAFGSDRLDYLRGDRRKEQSATNKTGPFRPRDVVLGDVVNSGIVYVGKPSLSQAGKEFRDFYDANKSRKSALYVNANDGMLHAFYDDTGAEAFAYVPGFLSSKLSQLPDLDYMHASLADATPAVADAFYRGAWRTTLVSGVGGGAQGVYALDVTNPATFSKDKVLWEFTDRDHPAMGNVLGAPQILKFRVTDSTATTHTYKWFAVVASGVNNNATDGNALTSGNASLFFLDLGFVPSLTDKWVEGTNFWRIELPQSDNSIAKGLVGFTATRNAVTGAVDQIYGGDMQGNLWKFDFSTKGTGSLVTTAATNFSTFNMISGNAPMFIAKNSAGNVQPITGEPTVINGFMGNRMIAFGTGKFLEVSDTTVPLAPSASFYTVLDTKTAVIADRSALQGGTISGNTVTVPGFVWGTGAGEKAGWYLDFDPSIAERQISDITAMGGSILFGSIYPTKGSCGEGGGRLYILNSLTGGGVSEESQVGVLAAPLVITLGGTSLTISDTAGQRTATEKLGVITQGAKGLKPSSLTSTYSMQVGRLSWRQLNNFQANKAAP